MNFLGTMNLFYSSRFQETTRLKNRINSELLIVLVFTSLSTFSQDKRSRKLVDQKKSRSDKNSVEQKKTTGTNIQLVGQKILVVLDEFLSEEAVRW